MIRAERIGVDKAALDQGADRGPEVYVLYDIEICITTYQPL